MKKFSLSFLKLFLFSLVLLCFQNKAKAWDPKDNFQITSENTHLDGSTDLRIVCQTFGGGNLINNFLNLQVKVDGSWFTLLYIKPFTKPVLDFYYEVNYTVANPLFVIDCDHTWTYDFYYDRLNLTINKPPNGVYNSPVEFRITENNDNSDVRHTFNLTFWKLKPPINLTATQDVCNQVNLAWDAPENMPILYTDIMLFPYINTYTIFKDGKEIINPYPLNIATGYVDTDVEDGKTYNYKVKLTQRRQNYVTIDRESGFSATKAGKSKPIFEAPENVSASTDRCDGSVLIEWEWPHDTPEQFKVERSTNSGFSSNVEVLRDDILNSRDYYEDTTPTKNVVYYYRVTGLNDCGDWGDWSSAEGYSPDIPETPTNINCSVSNDVIHVSWDHSGFEDKYIITRTNIKSGVSSDYETDRDINWFDDENAELCTPYTYEVKAINNCGTSQKTISDEVVLTPDLSNTFWTGAVNASKGYYPDIVHLKWENNNRHELDLFYIYRKEYGSIDSTLLATVDATLSMFDDHYAENSVLYEYSIKGEKLCNDNSVFSNVGTDIGFKVPTATVTGRVTFPAGTGVGNVSISASTTDIIPSSSILLGTNSYVSVPQAEEMDIASAFTFQSYLKFDGTGTDHGILEKSGIYKLTYEGGKFNFFVGNEFVEFEKEMMGDKFVHLTCVYDGSAAFIYIPDKTTDVDGNIKDTLLNTSASISNAVTNNTSEITFGFANTLYYSGNIDEIRIWGRALASEEIQNDYNRYLSGKEEAMLGYWRMNEGFGNNIYDISKTGSSFNENHGEFISSGVLWSTVCPTLEQLNYRGITDLEGNYIIAGIPFTTGGSSYKFTPMMAPHEFEPDYKILFINEDAPVVNNVDFIDKSVVPVSLTVFYKNTHFPVEAVWVKVDGQFIADQNGELVQTKEDGMVDFEVPIGEHYLSFEKQNHTFNNPYFPGKDPDGNILRHYFNKTESIKIFDTTRVRLAGRIVGGPVEAAKVLGIDKLPANPSVNNIGVVNVELTTVRGFDIDFDENGDPVDGTPKTISFSTDPETGEYSIWLLPEQYKPASDLAIKNSRYLFNSDNDKAIIDLSS